MSAQATQAEPTQDPDPHATDTRGHGAALDNLISMGTGIARLLHDRAHAQAARQAAAQPQPEQQRPPQAAAAQPAPAPAPAASLQDLAAAFDSIARTAARKRILRAVEDTLQRQDYDDSYRDCDPTEVLHAELLDRMDAPDLDRDIASRPIDDIIKDILRDLGLAALPGTRPWKRRTPSDIAELNARAAAPTPVRQPGDGPQDPGLGAGPRPPTDPPPANPGSTGNPPRTPVPPEPAAIPRTGPAPAHPGPGLPKDPAEAVAFVLHHSRTRGHWRPPPGA